MMAVVWVKLSLIVCTEGYAEIRRRPVRTEFMSRDDIRDLFMKQKSSMCLEWSTR